MRLLLLNLAVDSEDPILGFTTSWIRTLSARMEAIHVITMRKGNAIMPENVFVYSVGKEKGYSKHRRILEFYRQLLRIIKNKPIDVCFSHMAPAFSILAAPVLKAKHIPLATWYAHRHVTTQLKMAHHLSRCMLTSAITAYGYKDDKLLVTGQGIDTNLFSPNGQVRDNPPLLLSVGRLSPIKDLLTLIQAVGYLKQQRTDVRLAFVGPVLERDKRYADLLKRRIVELQLADIVQFIGALPQTQVAQWYRRCFAHVNLCPYGALDKAALEAMACGSPSLVANEGFAETLGQYKEQLSFVHGDAQDLARKLANFLKMKDVEREAIGTHLRQKVIHMHSLENLSRKLVKIFEELKRG